MILINYTNVIFLLLLYAPFCKYIIYIVLMENKVEKYHTGNSAETAAYALRCIAYAVRKATENARKHYPGLDVVFSGGVSSNFLLREQLQDLNPVFCEPKYSTDNAIGVAVLTHRLLEE